MWVPGACWKHPERPASNLKERENYPVVQVAWGRRGRLCEVGVGIWLDGFMRGDDATRRMGVQKVKEMIEELCGECSKRNGEMRATGLMVAKAKLSEARRAVEAASKPKTRKRKARVGKS